MNNGVIFHNKIAYWIDANSHQHRLWTFVSGYRFGYWQTGAYKWAPDSLIGMSYVEFEFDSYGDPQKKTIKYRSRTDSYQILTPAMGFSLAGRITLDQYMACISHCKIKTQGQWAAPQGVANLWLLSAVAPTSPAGALNFVDSKAYQVIDKVIWRNPETGADYGDLAMKAVNKVNANSVNMIAFFRDLRDPAAMIPKLRNLSKLKTLADNYLVLKYGILPTIDDLQSIFEAFKRVKPHVDRNGFSVYRATESRTLTSDGIRLDVDQRIKVAIEDEDDEFQMLIQRLDSMGFYPTFQNVWDLIPYSFVLDWFVDVGGFLERVDTRLRIARLNIRYATMSRKDTGMLAIAPAHSTTNPTFYTGSIQAVHYQRWVSDQCPQPPAFAQSETDPLSHWIEGAALIAQRGKK
jgi:hypothetical protein